MADLVEKVGSMQAIPDLDVVERVNRRVWAFERELELRMCPLGAGIVESIGELRSMVAKGHDGEGGWLVKSDLGGAGRGQRRIRGETVDRVVLDWVVGRSRAAFWHGGENSNRHRHDSFPQKSAVYWCQIPGGRPRHFPPVQPPGCCSRLDGF